jgi:hypothetical protein
MRFGSATNRTRLLGFVTILSLGCMPGPGGTPASPTSVWARSYNRSPVDVYLLCGSHDARKLGIIQASGTETFEIPAAQGFCVEGLNFFLVVRQFGGGYWVGPFQPERSTHVNLVIEKYAGLSTANLIREPR